MSKLPSISGRDCVKALQKIGFYRKHQVGSHFDLDREADIGVSAAAFTIPISLRLNRYMLSELKAVARKKDIAYQSLIKTYIARELERERKAS